MIQVRKGGYTVLDLSNVTLTVDSDGHYNGTAPVKSYTAIKDGGKPVMVSGLKLGSTIYSDSLATFTIRAASKVNVLYLIGGGSIDIEVSNAGAVTVIRYD